MQQQLMQQQHQQQQQATRGGAYNTTSITTDHIQQYLDENKSLILRILENQNSGKLGECAENQAKLQRNLMYLAAIADSQPPPSPMYAQGGMNYMQHQQSQPMVPDPAIAARPSMFYGQQHPYMALQQQQAMQSQLGISSAGSSAGHSLQSDITLGSGGSAMFPNFGRSVSSEGWQAANRGVSKKEDNGSTGSVEDHSGKS
ncbi:GRF-interacting factor 1-like [Apium graveolens]|uniref:GRF-interacting factor 1-like n=1 Tax=Apium graveolens TaxID=4045 RepID=UPI003D7B5C2A